MKNFNDWFLEMEGHCLRAERFYESLSAFQTTEGLSASMLLWLNAAYEMGREHALEEAINISHQYERKMDAGKEHITFALEALNGIQQD